MWHMTCVDDFLNRAFYKLGLIVGRHPGYFVIVPILLACICFTGYQKIHYEIDPEYLFSPVNGPGKTERAIVEQYFKVNYSHQFNVGRITRPGEDHADFPTIPAILGDLAQSKKFSPFYQSTRTQEQRVAFVYVLDQLLDQ